MEEEQAYEIASSDVVVPLTFRQAESLVAFIDATDNGLLGLAGLIRRSIRDGRQAYARRYVQETNEALGRADNAARVAANAFARALEAYETEYGTWEEE